MDVNPGPSHPAELVVHVVFLVQEELQHQAMVRTCHCHLPYLEMRRYFRNRELKVFTSLPKTPELNEKQFPYFG